MQEIKIKNDKIYIYLIEEENFIKKNNFRFDDMMDKIINKKLPQISLGEYDFVEYKHLPLKNINVYKITGEFFK